MKAQASLLAQQNENLKETQKSSDTLHNQLAASDREVRALKIQVQELTAAQETHFAKIRELNGSIVRLESEKIHAERDRELLQQELKTLREQAAKPSVPDNLALDHVPRRSPGKLSAVGYIWLFCSSMSSIVFSSFVLPFAPFSEYLRVETEVMALQRKLEALQGSSLDISRLNSLTDDLTHKLRNAEQQISDLEHELLAEQEKNRIIQTEKLDLLDQVNKAKVADASEKDKRRILALESKLGLFVCWLAG